MSDQSQGAVIKEEEMDVKEEPLEELVDVKEEMKEEPLADVGTFV